MSAWINFHTFVAFILGVLLAAYVKALVSKVKGAL